MKREDWQHIGKRKKQACKGLRRSLAAETAAHLRSSLYKIPAKCEKLKEAA